MQNRNLYLHKLKNMPQVNPYLNFNGNAEEAINLYQKAFGKECSQIIKFKDMPSEQPISEEDGNKIMHAILQISNETSIMISDTLSFMPKTIDGNNISISINTESEEKATNIFNCLSEGGNITMPLEKTFWGAFFGMWTDKFGINWMVNYDYPKEEQD